jgi:nucleoredoxin
MRLALVCFVFLLFAFAARATQLPLTAKDVSLMLRTGYSSKTIIEELADRRFADTLDATTEAQLVQSGATPELVNALKNGTYAVSVEEAARAQEQKEAQATRRALEAEKSRQFNTLYQAQVARERSFKSAQAAQMPGSNAIYQFLKGDLVQCRNGALTRFDGMSLEKKKLFLIYFSAYWCGPCRKFTPLLVDYYNRVAPQHPELELIFVSRDKSPFAMETYMRDMKMPWPAIDYQKVAGKQEIAKYAGEGIPDLVLVDGSGKVISTSYDGKKYLGPGKVLTDLETVFAGKPPGQTGVSR